MTTVAEMMHRLHEDEIKLLHALRLKRRERTDAPFDGYSFGDKVADRVAATMGSWSFIIIQTAILIVWIILNVTSSAPPGVLMSSTTTSVVPARARW